MLTERLLSSDFNSYSPTKQLRELLTYEAASQYCPYHNDSVRILLLQRISKLYRARAENSKAIYYTSKAINIATNNLQNLSINPSCQIENYFYLARIYNSFKKTSEKITAYDSCIAVARRLKISNFFFIYALLEKARYLNDNGDYHLCISQCDKGEMFSHNYVPQKGMEKYGDSTSLMLDFAIQKINALLSLQKYKDAEICLTSELERCKMGRGKEYFGTFCEQLALTKIQQKKYEEALNYFNQALDYYKELKDTLSYKNNLHNIGYLYEIKGDDKEVLFYNKKSLHYTARNSSRRRLDSLSSVIIYSNIGNVFARRGQFDSALCYFQYAFNHIKKGTNETEVLNSSLDEFTGNQNENLTNLFIDKGNAFYKQFEVTKKPVYINEAIRIYKLTDRLLERIKISQLELQSKLFWRKLSHPFYEHAIEACIMADKQDEAFYFFERSRATLLYDQIKEQMGLNGTDISKLQDLDNKIIDIQKKLSRVDPTSVNFKEMQIEISNFNDARNILLQKIKIRNPLYFNNFLDSTSISLYETRKSILTDKTLVEIFAGDSSIYSMIVTTNNIYFNKINKSDYDSMINLCVSYMSDRGLANDKNQFETFIKNSRRLYELIFQNRSVPDGRVIISTDGRYFPFETLVTGLDHNQPVYFLQKHLVSYTYSARYLMSQFSGKTSEPAGDLLGIAPVNFPANDHLPILPGSDKAIKRLENFFNDADTILREQATKDNFLKRFGRYQIIQLYSHSSESSVRDEPVIYFSDKPLYFSELRNIKTPATKLIVLSACETGNGHFYQGEGVFSFDRAFAALGIPSCVNNLWSVDNESTYKITELFYKYISKGLTIDEALQRAKLEFIKTSSANPRKQRPYYWAATIVAGKTDVIQLKNNSKYGTICVITITTAALLFIWKFVIRKRNQMTIIKDQ